jgi:hypothetical protein
MKEPLRIVADGTPTGSHIFDADGKELENVTYARVEIAPLERPHASIELLMLDVDVCVEDIEHSVACGYCGRTLRHEPNRNRWSTWTP